MHVKLSRLKGHVSWLGLRWSVLVVAVVGLGWWCVSAWSDQSSVAREGVSPKAHGDSRVHRLMDVSVRFGFPESAGTHLVARRAWVRVRDPSSLRVCGFPSPTRAPEEPSQHPDGASMRLYIGGMRQLPDGDWLMGDCEVIPDADLLHSEAISAPLGISVAEEVRAMYLDPLIKLGPFMAAASADIARAIANVGRDDDALRYVDRPVSALIAMRSGKHVPEEALRLIDARMRLDELRRSNMSPTLCLVEEALNARPFSESASEADVDAVLHERLASGAITWPRPRTEADLAQAILVDWFAQELAVFGLRDERPLQAISALGGVAEAGQRERLEFFLECLRVPVGGDPSSHSTAKKLLSGWMPAPFRATDSEPFTAQDLEALIACLDDREPTRWIDADGTGHPVADTAIRGIAGIIGCDPRLLFGLSPDAPWSIAAREDLSGRLRSWHRATRLMALPDALVHALQGLEIRAGVRLFLALPRDIRHQCAERVALAWLGKPFDARSIRQLAMANLATAFIEGPHGRELLDSWRIAEAWPLMDALIGQKLGDGRRIDRLLERLIGDEGFNTAQPQLVRQIFAVYQRCPSAARKERILRMLNGPLEGGGVHALLMSSVCSSDWIDEDLQPLMPGSKQETVFNSNGTAPTFQRSIWHHLISDRRPIPQEIMRSMSITSQGRFVLDHPGAQIMVAGALDDPIAPTHASGMERGDNAEPSLFVIPSDLRVCDLTAYAILLNQPQLRQKARIDTAPNVFFLGCPLEQRTAIVDSVVTGFFGLGPVLRFSTY
jgi:hypothetical protein